MKPVDSYSPADRGSSFIPQVQSEADMTVGIMSRIGPIESEHHAETAAKALARAIHRLNDIRPGARRTVIQYAIEMANRGDRM